MKIPTNAKILEGPKGGEYYINDKGRKVYIKTASIKRKDYRGKTPSVISLGNPYGTCCCCGKALTREDKFYYDLDSYCIDCAILDGIRTSK